MLLLQKIYENIINIFWFITNLWCQKLTTFCIGSKIIDLCDIHYTTFSENFQIKRLPGEVLKVLNLPVPTYDLASESAYSLTNLLHSIFGVDGQFKIWISSLALQGVS